MDTNRSFSHAVQFLPGLAQFTPIDNDSERRFAAFPRGTGARARARVVSYYEIINIRSSSLGKIPSIGKPVRIPSPTTRSQTAVLSIYETLTKSQSRSRRGNLVGTPSRTRKRPVERVIGIQKGSQSV